ncbi:MAG: polymer-forming cytoskeletal protein [Nitrospina sp.]|jgi:cytoskeletal protein CcmA (bactofilin family)|nr:polymer-forming cytoskeletal protein [Nitrospina sp.]
MTDIKLKVLTEKDFYFLAKKTPEGVYDKETREKLLRIIKRLNLGKDFCTGDEKQLRKKFKNSVFGILYRKDSETNEKINHPGKIHLAGKFSGDIVAESVLIEKTATVFANIAAEEVLCKGVVRGDIRATDKVKITKEAEVTGDIHSPNLNIEKGALFEGRCSMPKNRKPQRLFWMGKMPKKAG